MVSIQTSPAGDSARSMMNFSGAAQTNVHRVDGILFVQWAKFVPRAKARSATKEAYEATQPAAASEAGQHADRSIKTSHAVNGLRDAGCFILQPEDESAIWVFELPKGIKHLKEEKEKPTVWVLEQPNPVKAAKDEKEIDYSKVLSDCGFTKSRAGSLRALDLRDALAVSNEAVENEYPSSEARIKAFEHAEMRKIYQHFITAVTKAILYSLALSRRYLPVAPCAFLDIHDISRNFSYYDSYHLDSSPSAIRLRTLNVQWFPSGSLVTSSSFVSRSVWPQTPRFFLEFVSHRYSDTSLPIILAPLGLNARLDPMSMGYAAPTIFKVLGNEEVEEETTVLGRNRRRWFESLVAMLQCHGVTVPKDMGWIPVRISLRSRPGTQKGFSSGDSEAVLWPASLCIMSDAGIFEDDHDNSWAWDDGDSKAHDPLASAEAWYLGEGARQEFLEARRRENELKAQAVKSPPSDEEGYLKNELPPTQKFLDPQAASGVYPTPPDGQPFHVGTSVTIGEPESMKPAEESYSANSRTTGTENPTHVDSASASIQRIDLQSDGHDAMDEDELFGDMNTGMFTATGLTEDDFNFFDEQDEPPKIAPSDEHVSSSTQCGLSESITTQIHGASGGDWDMLTEESPDRLAKQDRRSEVPPTIHNEASESTPNTAIDHGSPAQIENGRDHPLIDVKGRTNSQSIDGDVLDNQVMSVRPKQVKMHDDSFSVSAIDRKYSASGKYASDLGNKPAGQEIPRAVQRTDPSLPFLDLLHKRENSDESSVSEDDTLRSGSPSIVFEFPSRAVRPEASAAGSTLKRKRSQSQSTALEDTGNEDKTRTQEDQTPFPMINVSIQQLLSSHAPFLLQEPTTRPRSRRECVGRGQAFVNLAQVVTEQVVLKSCFDDEESYSLTRTSVNRSDMENPPFEDPLRGVITRFFPHSKRIELSGSIVAPETTTATTHPTKALPKPPTRLGDSAKSIRRPTPGSESVFELSDPNVLAHRADNLMELSSMALNFWEELGLAPCKGAKSVRAICVIPQSEPMRRTVSTFHDSVSGTWQSMKLGNHAPLGNVDALSDGCFEVPFVRSDMEKNFDRLDRACEDLGRHICDSEVTETNLVIYMVNPDHSIRGLPRLCGAFVRLKEFCEDFVDVRDLKLVLKVIPFSILAVQDTIALPSPAVYRQLARDVYDLCAVLDPSPEPVSYTSSSLVQLAGEIPKKLDFRLAADAPSPLSSSDSAYYVGYSCDERGEWLATALTDARGTQHWQASYCLKALASHAGLQDIFKDICEIALEMIGSTKVNPRIVITKDEPFGPFEINAWTSLASDPSLAPATLILVSLDLSPALLLSNPPTQPSSKARQPTMPSTPLTPTTPGPNTPTPAGPLDTSSIDPSLRLISIEDQTWAVVNLQPIDQDPAVPAPGHGLLVMNTVPPDGLKDPNVENFRSIGVQIVHHSIPCGDTVLRDVLKAFKALGTIAKARGVMGSRGGLVPWHIAVAREARNALNESMHWSM